jgi:hypothetical protein
MLAVKIECPCGQHYAFDVEPVDGQMSSTVACPACGADGTPAANEFIARQEPAPPVAAPSKRIRVAVPAAGTPARPVLSGVRGVGAATLGLVDRETAETQARAKISWGDSQEEVIGYLMMQGFSAGEAKDFVAALFKERLRALRLKGIRKIFVGAGLMCVPVIELLIFLAFNVIPMLLMAFGVMIGLWGAWQVLNGILLIVAPKMESSDVAAD